MIRVERKESWHELQRTSKIRQSEFRCFDKPAWSGQAVPFSAKVPFSGEASFRQSQYAVPATEPNLQLSHVSVVEAKAGSYMGRGNNLPPLATVS